MAALTGRPSLGRAVTLSCYGNFQFSFTATMPLTSLSSAETGNCRIFHSPVPEMPANFPVPATGFSVP